MKPELKPLFLERIKKLLPNDEDLNSFLEILKKPLIKSIRCNTLKISPEELKKRLESLGWKIKQLFKEYPEIMVVEGKYVDNKKDDSYVNNNHQSASDSEHRLVELEPGELGRSLEHILGYYYVQEIASMLPVLALRPEPGELVLDLAAAPGSKTTQLAAFMKNTGAIIANDINLKRLKILASNMERCGVLNAIITKKDGIVLCKRLKENGFLFDKILVDAPCSGEGTLRSSPVTYEMWNPKTIKILSRLQKALLASAIGILKPHGEIVYSTCTHAPEENEEVVNFVIKEFQDVKIESINLPIKYRSGITEWNGNNYNQEVKKSCRIYPQDNDTEGFFIAKFRRIK